jgi:hypothetical protein
LLTHLSCILPKEREIIWNQGIIANRQSTQSNQSGIYILAPEKSADITAGTWMNYCLVSFGSCKLEQREYRLL